MNSLNLSQMKLINLVVFKKGNLKDGGNIEIDDEYLDENLHNINL